MNEITIVYRKSLAELYQEIERLQSQLAARDALIERLVEAGGKFTANTFGVGEWYGLLETWQALVAEYRAMKKESVE